LSNPDDHKSHRNVVIPIVTKSRYVSAKNDFVIKLGRQRDTAFGWILVKTA